MWLNIEDSNLVKWCLEHGASVHPRDQEPLSDDVITLSQRQCEQILEKVAAWGGVATYELLRSKERPVGGVHYILPLRLLLGVRSETTENMMSEWLWYAISLTWLGLT
ncbi:hypothetical protein GQ44DRAFT_702324 [Phaeosphaeriaceae sp. PMI808]|nr:hypothetical protein GQ44DRAFT_702324 [Phaeosphaeriaceae sp. PMI808]